MNLPFLRKKKKRIYLDYASSTPVAPFVVKILNKSFSLFQNPSSIHKEGVSAKRELEQGRKEVAGFLGAQPDEIIFTASGTESCVIAIRGVIEEALQKNKIKPHVIVSSIEHSAILETIKSLENESKISVTYLKVDKEGRVSIDEIKESLRPETILVSVMMVNNEIGTIEPIKEIGLLLRKHKNQDNYPLFHTDASQAVLYNDLTVLKLHTDLMTLDGIKCYGPRGIGVMFRRRGVSLKTIITGGGQEFGIRSGTENVGSVMGLARALLYAKEHREKESKRVEEIRLYTKDRIKNIIPSAIFNESEEHHSPHILSVCFPGSDAEYVVISLDALNIATAWGSACQSVHGDTSSYVLSEIGKGDCAKSSVRLSFGRETTKKDIDILCEALLELVHRKVITS